MANKQGKQHEQGAQRAKIRYVAIGDSFTEGVGDEQPDGYVRGWADLVAQGLADATGEPVQYANFAIRGRLLAPIIAEQLQPALDLQPTLLTFNGGGNDMLRPRTDIPWIMAEAEQALRRVLETDTEPLFVFGPNPTVGIPRGPQIKEKGDQLTAAATELTTRMGIRYCDNWSDPTLARREYWAPDRLHLNTIGHHRVASNVLRSLGHEHPADWVIDAAPVATPGRREQLRYTREYVVPWIGRRLTGRSSGDGREPKQATWRWVEPRQH